ncbi:Pentatricopeptide repeat-containing protein [Hibiscus syriacus]|uniref:Pentatricopeptide repeat-containing protein n=1 Tax=Hibiscus syriacus TaxID=106335 RepID=A0A6A2Y1P4_HIBSY|nr:pentatricopeptide repeat-containing protein At5g50390, chloroplastic-like [Hibiscus syriacus]KAE8661724.1 Pentatricopeptide repeat-containing protein [Hibiscus syriacus]
MEVSLARYQSISFDQIRNNCRFPSSVHNVFTTKPFFSGYCFRFSRRKWGSSFDTIKCFSLEQGLQPRRPKPKPPRNTNPELKETEETQIKRPSVGLCSQIEKLALCNRYREALELFEILELEGGFDVGSSTYDALVSACIGLGSVRAVKRVFNYMVSNGFEPDQYMSNRMLHVHVKCGMMIDARNMFDEMPEKNLVSWNTIIAGLFDSGDYLESFRLFLLMWEEFSDCGSRTFATMIRASAGLELISVGKQLHSCAVKIGVGEDIFVSCALIDMYSNCGSIEDAQWVFDDMPEKTTVGWNSIIAGYALHGYSEEALSMFYEMQDSGVKMDHFTFSMIIRICSRLASVEYAKQAHAGLIRYGFGSEIVASTALVDFYSKWGRIEDAKHVFDRMPRKNTISWNAVIAGYGNHGRGAEAVELFEQMLREKMRPNHVTFLAVLSACSYSRLSERGWEIFQSMGRDHKIKPRAMHYACMIELLGQEGLLDEAFALIRAVPFQPTANMWAALLTASRVNGNLELGKFAAENLYGMEPEKLSNYVVLMNIYNRSGRLKESAAVLQTLRRKGLRMLPVCSWIEVNKRSHVFLSGDKSHVHTDEIYRKVDSLIHQISKCGYVPEEKTLLPDVDEQEQRELLYHSEKLAVAFGLLNTMNRSSPLQIVQSHRICNDCHNAIKLIALVTRREIIVRDASRFHYFRHGSCSCGDYW